MVFVPRRKLHRSRFDPQPRDLPRGFLAASGPRSDLAVPATRFGSCTVLPFSLLSEWHCQTCRKGEHKSLPVQFSNGYARWALVENPWVWTTVCSFKVGWVDGRCGAGLSLIQQLWSLQTKCCHKSIFLCLLHRSSTTLFQNPRHHGLFQHL